jgi:hypothetical protein
MRAVELSVMSVLPEEKEVRHSFYHATKNPPKRVGLLVELVVPPRGPGRECLDEAAEVT